MDFMPNSREEIAHMLDGTIDWEWGENANTTEAIDYVYNNCTDLDDYDHHLGKFLDEAGPSGLFYWEECWEEFWGHYVMSQYLLSLNDDPSEYDLSPKAIEAAKKRMSCVVCQDTSYYVEQLETLVDYTIKAVAIDKGGFFGLVLSGGGCKFKGDDGEHEVVLWILQDEEGNAPGAFHVTESIIPETHFRRTDHA